MIRFIRTILATAFYLMLFFVPLSGVCQIATPTWVNTIGGPNARSISAAVKTDRLNNVYVTGYFSGTIDFDPSGAQYNLTSVNSSYDVYVAKYTVAGRLIWAVKFGGSNLDEVNSMTVDPDGNPIISGQYNSTDFDADPGPGTSIFPTKGDFDAFVVKLNTNGEFIWAKSIGGTAADYGGRVSVDSQGNMVNTIRFQDTVVIDGNTFISQQGFNGLAIKYTPGGTLLWAINLTDAVDCRVGFGDFDHDDNFVVCGTFTGSLNFNPLGAPYFLDGKGNATFLAKYTSMGQLLWAKAIYGEVVDNNNNLAINSKNEIFLTGPFRSRLDFTSTMVNSVGLQDLFLAKYMADGTFTDVKTIGREGGSIFNYGIIASADDNIYLSGYFSGTIDFNPSPQEHRLNYHGNQDFFLAKYDEDLNYKLAFGGGSADCDASLGRNLAIDRNNDLIFTGSFCSEVDFSASACTPRLLTAQGISDTFLAKYRQAEASGEGRIKDFYIAQQVKPPVIDQTNLKITVTVPTGTNVTALAPTVSHNNNIVLDPTSRTPQDFTYPVIYTLSVPCLSLNYVVEVVFDENVIQKQATICNGNTIRLIGDIVSGIPESYSWELLDGAVWVNAEGLVINGRDYLTETLNNEGTANLLLSFRRKVTTNGLITYDSFYGITVLPAISNNTIATPTEATFCGSIDIAEIIGTVPAGGDGIYGYQWQQSADDITFTNITGATSRNYDPPLISANVHYRRIVTTCGQLLSSNTIHYYIQPLPAAPIVGNTLICPGTRATLTAIAPANTSVKWYREAQGGTSVFTGNILITPPVNENTTIYAEAVSQSGCVSARTPVLITMIPALPAPRLTVTEVSLNSVTINWEPMLGAAGYEVKVDNGEFVRVNDGMSYTATGLKAQQTVTFSVRAVGLQDCQLGAVATVSGTAITPAINQVYVPNLFSPNGDGANDILYVRSEGIKSMDFKVYSQWGEMIFRSVNQASGWDGTFRGAAAPVGVYMYYVDATMHDGSKVNTKGSVTLVR